MYKNINDPPITYENPPITPQMFSLISALMHVKQLSSNHKNKISSHNCGIHLVSGLPENKLSTDANLDDF